MKARILSDAVIDNVDTISGALPKPLRSGRRWLALWGPRLGGLAIPVGLGIALTGAAWRPAVPASVAAPVARAAPAATTEPTTAGGEATVDRHALSLPVHPSVLELGVRRVILDAGHGGTNNGTASSSGLQEKALTLDIALRDPRSRSPVADSTS